MAISNAEIQKQALSEMQADSERGAICMAKECIKSIAYQQEIIENALVEITRLKGNLSLISVKDYSKGVV